MRYFSPSAGFLDSQIHARIPDDAVKISERDYTRLLTGQAEGRTITISAEGKPELSDSPAGPDRRQVIEAELERIDVASLRPLRALLAGFGTDADKARVAELETAAAALREELKQLD